MLEKIHKANGWVCHCDNCSEQLEMEGSSGFEEALEIMREEGWRPRHKNGEWIHLCPDCLKESDKS